MKPARLMLYEQCDILVDGYIKELSTEDLIALQQFAPEYGQFPRIDDESRVLDKGTGIVKMIGGRKSPYWKRHYRDEKHWYCLINFNKTNPALPHFMGRAKYDVFFPKAVASGFYESITVVDAFIYDFDGGECIGYRMPILNPLPTGSSPPFDQKKLDDLISRAKAQSNKYGLILTDFGGWKWGM